MRGRKPKPAALHKLEGTLHVTRAKQRGPEPEAPGDVLAEPPEWMTEGQAASWRYAVAHAPAGILRRIDHGILAVWCEAEDRHRRATEAQALLDRRQPKLPFLMANQKKKKERDPESGEEREVNDGPPVLTPSPYLSIITAAGSTMARTASELGFSPTARPRLSTSNPGITTPNDSPWQRLRVLQGGKKE
jgi:phage terminase small subunit